MKPVLMIHEVREWMFDLPLGDYHLSFDDALYSQYYYLDRLLSYDTTMTFYVSTNIYSVDNLRYRFDDCVTAHRKVNDQKDYSNYMTWGQLRIIDRIPNCRVGGHGHNHLDLRALSIKDSVAQFDSDLTRCLAEFERHMLRPCDAWCMPYNYDPHQLFTGLVRRRGITNIVGCERTPIETLQPSELQ